MYLLYESLYGDLLNENDSTCIIGLYKDKKQAIEKAEEIIKEDTTMNQYILDLERNNLEEDSYVRLFWNCQENWNCYYEIIIEELEVK